MTRSSIGVLSFSAVALLALGACRNGPNNASDTNGVNGASAAGQMAPVPGATPGTLPSDTTSAPGTVIPPGGAMDTSGKDTTKKADTTKADSTKKSMKRKHHKKAGY